MLILVKSEMTYITSQCNFDLNKIYKYTHLHGLKHTVPFIDWEGSYFI